MAAGAKPWSGLAYSSDAGTPSNDAVFCFSASCGWVMMSRIEMLSERAQLRTDSQQSAEDDSAAHNCAASTAPLIDCRRAREQLLTDCAACTAELADVERSQGRGGGGGHGSR